MGAFCKLGADAAHAEDGEAFSEHLYAGVELAVESALDHGGVCGADVSGEGEHECEGVLSGGNGISRRGVHDDDAVVGGGIAVDIVHAYAGAADGFEIGGGSEDFRGDLRLGADHEAVVFADACDEFFRGHAGLNINGDAFGGAEGFNAFFRNGVGYEDSVVAHEAPSVNGKWITGKWKRRESLSTGLSWFIPVNVRRICSFLRDEIH